MPKRNKLKNAIKVCNISEMMGNKEKRKYFTFCITPNGGYYWVGLGKKLSDKKFNELYPIDVRVIRNKGIDPDGRRKFITE